MVLPMGVPKKIDPNLTRILERLRDDFDERYLDSDPLRYVHRYPNPTDQEIVAFIVATLSFGNVKAIFSTVERVLGVFTGQPAGEIRDWSPTDRSRLDGIYHRWIKDADLHVFFLTLSSILREFGSLEAFFGEGDTLEDRIRSFSSRFRERLIGVSGGPLSRGLTFMVPTIGPGSVMKRFNMFLRWVVRQSPPDLGLWRTIDPSEIYFPMDTHMIRILGYLGAIQSKDRGWKMVQKATASMALHRPWDPVGYDFALCRLGILGHCQHRFVRTVCPSCPLSPHCRLAKHRLTRMTR